MKCGKFIIIVFCLLFIGLSAPASGQLTKIDLGINGLTCSQCSRSVEMQLRKLPFIESVTMDLERTKAELVVSKYKKTDWESIARAVKNGGFSVRYLTASFDLANLDLDASCFSFQGNAFYLVAPFKKQNKKNVQLQLIGKDFLPKKEFSRYQLEQRHFCKGKNVYFVKETDAL